MPVNSKGKNAACNLALPIFDGAARCSPDIKLSSAGAREVELSTIIKGPISICQALRCWYPTEHQALRLTQHEIHCENSRHHRLACPGREHRHDGAGPHLGKT